MKPVNDDSRNVAPSLEFMKRICSASDYQEGFIEVTAKYAIQLLADKLGCPTPDLYTDGCQEIVEEQWQKHLGFTETSNRDYREYLIDKVLSGLESHMRKLIFCVRENKLLSFASALPPERSHLCREEIKVIQREKIQSETQVVNNKWKRRVTPKDEPAACSSNGLAGGGSDDVALLESPRPYLAPVWKTIEVPDPPGDLWDWTTPLPIAEAFQPWTSSELITCVRCDPSRKESLFLCVGKGWKGSSSSKDDWRWNNKRR